MRKNHLWLILVVTTLVVITALVGASGDAFWLIRLPRVATGFAVGALLALSGLAMQVLLRNPLADPYVMGTSGGAAFGAVLALILGGTMWLGATIGAACSAIALLWLARRTLAEYGQNANAQLTLMGAMLAATLGAGATLLLTLTSDEQLRGAVFWLVGDLSSATNNSVGLLIAVALLVGFVLYLSLRARSIDRLQLGANAAWQLGENVTRLRWELLLFASFAVACCVALSGSIGFVGLVIPQGLRLWGVFSTRRLAWLCVLSGGALLVAADAVARTIAYPLELPVGAVMALIGAPILIWFLSRKTLP